MNKTVNKSVLIVDGTNFTEKTFKNFQGKLALTKMSQLFVANNKKYPINSHITVRAIINGMASVTTRKGILLCDEDKSYYVYLGLLSKEEKNKSFTQKYGRNPSEVLADYYSLPDDDFWKLSENMKMLEAAKKIEFK